MDGLPEGTRGERRRVPKAVVVLTLIFAAYLVFRLLQAVMWLVQHV